MKVELRKSMIQFFTSIKQKIILNGIGFIGEM